MGKKKKDDKELRKELKSFVDTFNQKHNTSFKSTGVKGSEHRSSSTRHNKYGAIDVGAIDRSKKGKALSDKFIDFIASSGFTVIDERDAKSKRKGKKNRNVIHIDAHTKDRGSKWDNRGTVRKELREKPSKGSKYPVVKKVKQKYYNEMLPEQKKELSKLVRQDKKVKEESIGVADNFLPNQSVEVMSRDLGVEEKEFGKARENDRMSGSLFEKLTAYSNVDMNKDIDKQIKNIDDNTNDLSYDPNRRLAMQTPDVLNSGIMGSPRKKKEEEVAKEIVQEKALPKALDMANRKRAAVQQTVKNNPNEVKEIVGNLPIDEATKRDVKKDIDNQARGKKRDPLSSQFTDALTYFLPTMIGGLGAGLIDGSPEAVVSGMEAGQEYGQGFRDYQQQQLDNNSAKQSDMDTSGFVDDQGNPVKVNFSTGQYTDLSGNPVDPSKIQRTNIFKQDRSLEQKEVQMGDIQKRFDLKQSQLSDKQTEDLEGLIKTQDALRRISLQASGVNTGPIASFIQSGREKIDLASDEFVRLKQELSTLNNEYIKLITGAQMSEPEAERIMQAMPSISDDDNTLKLKVKVLQEIMESQEKAFAQAIATGQKLKGASNDAIRNILDKHKIGKSNVKKTVKSNVKKNRSSYEQAVANAKSLEEISKIKQEYGVK